MAWDTSKHVLFTIPFKDTKAEIYLDALLPRIVNLAEGMNSPKRS